MIEHDAADPQPPRPAAPKWGPTGKSLFGAAILATVATVSLTQIYDTNTVYVADVNALNTTAINEPGTYVALGGYTISGDGGGGVLLPQSTTVAACAPDGGLVFGDGSTPQHCFVRANPTNSVREWGALCDVTSETGATWTPNTLTGTGTLSIPGTLTAPQTMPQIKEYIAISQIGVPTLWGSSTPAVSMTRFSTLSNTGINYVPGDLISFAGGTFSQQAAIIVDAVDGGGAITQWHFLWGGLYNAANPPTGAMAQDDSRSYCGTVAATGSLIGCGTVSGQAGGAVMTPAWSGWSVLNNQGTPTNAGTGYAVGDIVTLTGAGIPTAQTHLPKLIVEGTTTSGGVTAYDWLDYGSLPATPAILTDNTTASSPSGLSFNPVAWTQAPFATTIKTVGSFSHNAYPVTLADNPPFPGTVAMNIKYLYYGHDDSAAIDRAILAAPKGGLVIPAGCGTTLAINLSPMAAATNFNPAQNVNTFLKGANLQSSGLYAFAPTPSARNPGSPGSAPSAVLAHVIYSGVLNTSNNGFVTIPGGGFSNMSLVGLGIPEGYGYHGLFENAGTPTGYMGPTYGAIPNNIPTAGNVVEIDASSLMRIDKVLIEGGGIGPGNSNLQCGLDESDPAHNFVAGSIANITLTDSRLDDGSNLFGPTNPDFVLRLDASCHDSTYDADAVFDGGKADILVYGANLFGRIHVNSDAANSGPPLATTPWPSSDTFGLAGLADYGFYVINNTSISETQCDIANRACIFTIPYSPGASSSPGQITDTQMKCGSYVNTPPGYTGVELSAETANTTVSGTAPRTNCTIYPFQVVKLDGSVDPTTSLCNNSYALVVGCTGYQGNFATGQSYTQPAVAYTTGTVTAAGLFAVPFFSPATGGTINKIGIDVTATGGMPPATQCLVGIYNSAAQAPTSLVVVGSLAGVGTVTATGTLNVAGTGTPSATLPLPGARLAPGTLYFLALACNGTATLEGVVGPSGLSVPLVGAPNFTVTSSGIVSSTWAPGTAALPNPFGTVTRNTGAWVPNVYANP